MTSFNLYIHNKGRVLFFSLFFLVSAFIVTYAQEVKENLVKSPIADSFYKRAYELRYKNPDSSIVLYQKSYDYYYKSKNYVQAVTNLSELGLVYENNANYAYSYDALWNALKIADDIKDDGLKTLIYLRLGRIYSYYKREKQSLGYLKKALKLQKSLVKRGDVDSSKLTPYYYALTSTSRELGNHEIGEKFLDSCFLYYVKMKSDIPIAYLDFEKAYFASQRKEYTKALEILENIQPWFQQNEPSYLVLVYKYWADIYFELSEFGKSEDYYNKALKVSSEYNSHIDFTPLIYEALATLHLSKKNYKKAFLYQKNAKNLDTRFFDSRSANNQSLLEIKDDFRLEKEQQEKIIQAQYLKELEQEEKIGNLKIVLLSLGIVSMMFIGFAYLRNLRVRHKAEKQLIRRNKELEIKKGQELVELKNRELAVSALQLIEKDEFLKTLKTKVRGNDEGIRTHEVNKVLRSISISNSQSWEEFKLRFIEVNESFYKEVSNKFPHLSQNDLKMCALIKLNFSSKEMARLLGISPESVHTKRYRLRKKMGLDQGVNLEDYIASL